jgi:polyferredoxin
MKEKRIKQIGMALFVVAALVFVGLTFFVDSKVEPGQHHESLKNKHPELYQKLIQIPEMPPAEMAGAVDNAILEYNEEVISQMGLTPDFIAKVLSGLDGDPGLYDEAFVNEYFEADPDLRNQILESTTWMMGREWGSFEEFSSNFEEKVVLINGQVLEKKGIGPSQATQVRQEIMENAAPGWLKTGLWAWIIFGMAALGGFISMLPVFFKKPGIHNNGIYHNKLQTRRWPAIVLFIFLVGFYIILYEFPQYLSNQIALLQPLSERMSGGAANQWFLYGFMYTLSMFVMGMRMMVKYRGNAYQQVRTSSVFFFQVVFAFTLPQILTRLQMPAYDIKSIWPLEYSFFFDYRVDQMLESGTFGVFLLVWGILLFAVGVPLLTYYYGKRWYCSWVCGCGGLAETVGDPFRHLSDKSLGAWKIERWLVHGVLVFAVVMTGAVLYTTLTGDAEVLGVDSYGVRSTYGFFIGFVFAGAVGTGFYPVMGNRVWCRFGCPLAAYLGLVQRFKSRFRITTNGGQCISCGNCSTYCEMGIDVRWYAQRGQNIVRSSCVGCGICSAVCPRGVLKLENKSEAGRINENPILIGREGVSLNL